MTGSGQYALIAPIRRIEEHDIESVVVGGLSLLDPHLHGDEVFVRRDRCHARAAIELALPNRGCRPTGTNSIGVNPVVAVCDQDEEAARF